MDGPHRKSESNLKRPSIDAAGHTHMFLRHNQETPATSSLDLPKPRVLSPHTIDAKNQAAPRRSFSLLRLRNASDPALGARARKYFQQDQSKNPPVPKPPAIITTAPTGTLENPTPVAGPSRLFFRSKSSEKTASPISPMTPTESGSSRSSFSKLREPANRSASASAVRLTKVHFDAPERTTVVSSDSSVNGPPPYDEHLGTLSIPPPRLSESSRSTASSSEQIAITTTTTTQTVQTTTTFWRLPRRKKTPQPLFPLPPKVEKEHAHEHGSSSTDLQRTPRPSFGSPVASSSPSGSSRIGADKIDRLQHASNTLAASALGLAGPGHPLIRSNSTTSIHSIKSNPASLGKRSIGARGRSMTMGAVDPGSIGRNSISGLFGMRLRRDSDSVTNLNQSRGSSPQPYSSAPTMTNSVAASFERLVIPERHSEDTPQMYLLKMEKAVSKSVLASLLARSDDAFHVSVLKTYMEGFEFRDDPMDMALRKLLMEAELPRETQQIDRVLQAFAERYHECNPLIYSTPEQAYFIAFSLLILHTDAFNKNNKHKMQKADYIRNTSGEGITSDVLECFYANITYTPFIHVEDDLDINGEKIVPQKPKRGLFSRNTSDGKRNMTIKEPVDPYALIMENRLDVLRPSLKEVIDIEDPYTYLGTANRLDILTIHKAFFRYAILQIVSHRSRPDAFLSPTTVANPQQAEPGLVDLKVTKIGIIWRKDAKKKKMRDPWQEWGAMLTGSQLYFFKNAGWIKSLMQQYEQHQKAGNTNTPVVFTPPLTTFKPDALVSTDDAVALFDRSYKKHKNAFAFIRHGGVQEYFLADTEVEMNDWLAKLNYAAAFRTAGVKMRGVMGSNDTYRSWAVRRIAGTGGSDSSTNKAGDNLTTEMSLRGQSDTQLAMDVANARRSIVEQRIADAEEKLENAHKLLDADLRNARHLSILTPIQAKTREQIVLAAGALSAKLQWVRIDMWKIRCHRDILIMDLEEEKKTMKDIPRRPDMLANTRRPSKTSTVSSHAPVSPPQLPVEYIDAMVSVTPEVVNLDTIPVLELPPPPSLETELKPQPFDRSPGPSIKSGHRRSESASSFMQQLSHTSTFTAAPADMASVNGTNSLHSATGISEDDLGIEIEPEKKDDKSKEKPKMKRGLQKTLREAHVPGHKSRKSISGDAPVEKKKGGEEVEGLQRGSSSFTLHGKKASVITFGSEWSSVSPEERLRRHKSNNQGDKTTLTDGNTQDVSQSTPLASSISKVDKSRLSVEAVSVPQPPQAPKATSSNENIPPLVYPVVAVTAVAKAETTA